MRPWPWQKLRAFRDERSSAPPVIQGTPWLLELLASVEEHNVLTTLSVLERQPYHASLVQQILSIFAETHDRAATISIEHVEQHLVLQEALALWQENSLQVPNRATYPISIHDASDLLFSIRVPEHNVHAQVPTMQERRTAALTRFWSEAHVPTQIHEELQKEHQKGWTWPVVQPRLLVRKPVFLYVFSGRRRKNDYQQFVEQFLREQGQDGQVLLIDLALSPQHDVTGHHLFDLFRSWFCCGCIASLLIAPPCETWSQARRNPTDVQNAPRPIRSAQFPFGLDGLTQAELDQILVSSSLLFVSLRLFFLAIIHQVPATMEHPHAPAKRERASIWFLPWIQRFLEHTDVELLPINQAEYGAGSLKPTHLLMCCLPLCRRAFNQHRVAFQWQDLQTLSGRDACGKWRTSYAKEYPGALNAAIAQAHVDAIACHRQYARVAEEPVSYQRDFEKLDAGGLDFEDQQMQPDYAKYSGTELFGLD